MRTLRFVVLAVSAGALALPARAQDVLTYTELKAKAPVALTRADLVALMPGAKMSRMNEKGSRHGWTNEPGRQWSPVYRTGQMDSRG